METKPYQRVWLEEAAPGETFIYKEGKAEREDVQNADIILGNVSPKLISTGDKLKWLQTDSAGVDGYIHGCLPKETVLTNATGAYGLAISEYMVAVWFELLKKLHLYRDVQRTGKWCDLGQVRSAWNSTVLVLGLGDIGGEFAKRAKALGARGDRACAARVRISLVLWTSSSTPISLTNICHRRTAWPSRCRAQRQRRGCLTQSAWRR